jgi:Na+-transporting NADH:ubiquinone oxidoreductase subunit A
MATAPFQVDPAAATRGHEDAFQAGLDVLSRLTDGKVHLCLAPSAPPALAQARNVEIHYFKGPHPAGNTSVHIHHVDPIRPGDAVWTAKAADVVLIGRLFLEGALPESRVVALGGPGVAEGARRHYRVRIGGAIEDLLAGKLEPGEQRIIAGDILAGTGVAADGFLGFYDSSVTVLPENRGRHFLGWFAPGLNLFSHSKTFLSTWLRPKASWALGTAKHGSERPMVLTGLYDRYLPMDILPDYLLRAILAHDTEEAVKLGILEVDPEDFALCAFACPSKMDLVGIVGRGLDEMEKEGI